MGTAIVCGAEPLSPGISRCPVCNGPGKRIKPETLKSMVAEDRLPADLEGYSICLSEECDTVYFGKETFTKKDVLVKVWFKEKDGSAPVCYCKGVTEKEILDHIVQKGCCENIDDIQRHTGANTGKECLFKNPAGT